MNCATLPLPWLLTPVDAKVKKDREKISLGKARPYRETKLVCKTDPPTVFFGLSVLIGRKFIKKQSWTDLNFLLQSCMTNLGSNFEKQLCKKRGMFSSRVNHGCVFGFLGVSSPPESSFCNVFLTPFDWR
jgi:hypothetical protein